MIKEINIEKEFENEIKENKKILLVDFYAKWCGPCKIIGPILKKFIEYHSEVDLIKVDVDKAMSLAMKYEIEAVPTLLLFRNGKIIRMESGILSDSELEKFVFGN